MSSRYCDASTSLPTICRSRALNPAEANGMSTGFHFARRSSKVAAAAAATSAMMSSLRIADLERLFQRLARIFRTVVLVRQPSGEAGLHDGLGHGAIIQLLGIVDLVPAGHAAGMKMADPLDVVLDGVDHVAL